MEDSDINTPVYSFRGLLTSLLLLFAVNPFIPDKHLAIFSFHFLFTFFILMAVYSLSGQKRIFYIGLFLAIPSLYTSWHSALYENTWLEMASHFLITVFLIYAIVILGKRVLAAISIDVEVVFGAICLYLFLGLAWAMIYSFMLDLNPESFTGTALIDDDTPRAIRAATQVENMIYFSFVTMTTLGFGDIVPVTLGAKFYSFLEAITGQMYIATVLARLIPMLRYKPTT